MFEIAALFKFWGYLAHILQIISLRFDVALQTSFKFRIVQKINACIERECYPFTSHHCELKQILVIMEWCFSRHRAKENRFGDQYFCARKLYIYSVTTERQKRKFLSCYEFYEYMVPNKTSGKYGRTENVWEGNCLIEILRRTVGETKQFVRILMYDLPLYLEKHNGKRTAEE